MAKTWTPTSEPNDVLAKVWTPTSAAAAKAWTPTSAADGVDQAIRIFDGRWKLVILFHLFGGKVLRFSDLERAIPAVSQKMLAQQLRQLEKDGVVRRIVHPQVPPKVEYALTDWGQALCPALDALLKWTDQRESVVQDAVTNLVDSRD